MLDSYKEYVEEKFCDALKVSGAEIKYEVMQLNSLTLSRYTADLGDVEQVSKISALLDKTAYLEDEENHALYGLCGFIGTVDVSTMTGEPFYPLPTAQDHGQAGKMFGSYRFAASGDRVPSLLPNRISNVSVNDIGGHIGSYVLSSSGQRVLTSDDLLNVRPESAPASRAIVDPGNDDHLEGKKAVMSPEQFQAVIENLQERIENLEGRRPNPFR